MTLTVKHLRQLYMGLRDGRANTRLLDSVKVPYCGSMLPLNHLASVYLRPRALIVEPYQRSLLPSVEKAILQSGLGLVPQRSPSSLLVPIPVLYRDQQLKYLRHAKKLAEDHRVAIRNIRRWLRKEEPGHASIDAVTKEFIERIDSLCRRKEADIMSA